QHRTERESDYAGDRRRRRAGDEAVGSAVRGRGVRAGHRLPHRRARQGARPDHRHRDAHARRAAVRARRLRRGRTRAGPAMSPRVRGSGARIKNLGARSWDFFDTYTRDVTAEDLQRLFTRDTRDAYRFFTRGVQTDEFRALAWHKRLLAEARVLFVAF